MALEEQFSEIIQDSVNDAFTTTLELTPVKIEEDCMPIFDEGIISSIGFTGTIEGNLAICLSNQGACTVVSKMLGMEIEEVDADVCDGVGEVTNMIIGGIKMKAVDINQKFDIGIPTAITGKELQVFCNDGNLIKIVRNFDCTELKFSVMFIYKEHEVCSKDASIESSEKSKAEDAFAKLNQLVEGSSEGKKLSPLDMLNAAVSSVEKKEPIVEESLEASLEEKKLSPLDMLNAAVSSAEKKEPVIEESVESPTEDKKLSPLDMLNAAVASAEKKEPVAEEKVESPSEEKKLSPLDMLNAAVASVEKKEPVVEEKKSSVGIAHALSQVGGGRKKNNLVKEEILEENKLSPLDLLNQAVQAAEKKEKLVEDNENQEISAIDRLSQLVENKEKTEDIQECEVEEVTKNDSFNDDKQKEDSLLEQLSPIDRLDRAMKMFKEVS